MNQSAKFKDVDIEPGEFSVLGTVSRINFKSNRFVIFLVRDQQSGNTLNIMGMADGIEPGALVRFEGLQQGYDRRRKRRNFYITERTQQLEAQPLDGAKFTPGERRETPPPPPTQAMKGDLPVDAKVLAKMLSEEVPGLGERGVENMIKAFDGPEPMLVALMANDAEQISRVTGVTGAVLDAMCATWNTSACRSRAILALRSLGLNARQSETALGKAASRIPPDEEYRGSHFITAAKRVCQHPYRLTLIDGIGFATADTAAQRLGQPPASPARTMAATREALHQHTRDGHTVIPIWQLAEKVAEMLTPRGHQSARTDSNTPLPAERDPIQIARCIWELGENEGLRFPFGKKDAEDLVTTRALYEAEQFIAQSVLERMSAKPAKEVQIPSRDELEGMAGHSLHDKQVEAINRALASNFMVITGGPGSGKTTIINTIVKAFVAQGLRVRLAAPTGMAAERMRAATGMEADTIHRTLGSKGFGRGFEHDASNPLEDDVLLLDEGSMNDVFLDAAILRGVSKRTRLIKVGDQDQLPSVGPGMVLGDLINSGIPPVARLTFTYRQGKNNPLVELARNVRDGIARFPDDPDPEHLQIIKVQDKADIARETIRQVMMLRDSDVPAEQFVVLSPMLDGVNGVESLNREIQRLLNGRNLGNAVPIGNSRSTRFSDKQKAAVNDRIVYRDNDKALGLSNGSVGTVLQIRDRGKGLLVDFGMDKPVVIDQRRHRHCDLAYVSTVHKSQGSEYRHVIMVLSPEHKIMMRRNLLYTGLTRPKHQLVLIGDPQVLLDGVYQTGNSTRQTMLSRLMHDMKPAFKGAETVDADRIEPSELPEFRFHGLTGT